MSFLGASKNPGQVPPPGPPMMPPMGMQSMGMPPMGMQFPGMVPVSPFEYTNFT